MEYESKAAFLKTLDLDKSRDELIEEGKKAGLKISHHDIYYARSARGRNVGKNGDKEATKIIKKKRRVIKRKSNGITHAMRNPLSTKAYPENVAFVIEFPKTISDADKFDCVYHLIELGVKIVKLQ